jgi:polyisoprenoid-binding protein YceI
LAGGFVIRFFINSLLILSCLTATVQARQYKVNQAESVLMLVTHKSGFAKMLSHDHFIYATDYKTKLNFRESDLTRSKIEATIFTKSLKNDEKIAHDKWYPLVKRFGLLKEKPTEIDESNIAKINEEMLGEGELNVKKFPEIKAVTTKITQKQSTHHEQKFEYELNMRVTIRGNVSDLICPANIRSSANGFILEGFCPSKFTDFKMEPVSVLFGAVGNKDEFEFVFSLSAIK